jgi:ATP-binding cassette, subfamily C, bacterial CydC
MRAWLWRHKGQTALSLLAATGTVLAGIGLLASSAYLISRAAERPPILDLILVIVAVRFFALSRAACRYAERLLSHDLTFRWLQEVRVRVYRVLEPHVPALLLSRRSGDLLARLGADVDTLQHHYLRVVVPTITAAVVVAVTVFALTFFAPVLAVTAAAFLLLNGVGVPWLFRVLDRGRGDRYVAARSQAAGELVEYVQGMADWLVFGQEARVRERIRQRDDELMAEERRQAEWAAWQDGLSYLCAHLGMWSVLVLAIPMVQSGRLGGVLLAMLTLGVLTSFEAVQALGTAFTVQAQCRSARQRIQEIEQRPRLEVQAPAPPVADSTIRVEAVQFAYEDALVLQDISFVCTAGSRVGLIGPSGAGKSTLLHLLQRTHDPVRGTVSLGGRDLRCMAPADVLAHIAVVPQHTYLFNNTIRENLRLARPGVDDAACWHALEQVRLAEQVRAMPDGLDTWLGEQGARLSGGERQRLAIARATLKDAPIWICDEPTSHLDPRTEQEIAALLFALSAGRSMLWATHRLQAVEQLDQVLVLNRGRIEERGTPAELVAANGYYARMLRVQNQWID